MFQSNKQKPNFVSWWIKERMLRASLCEVHKPSALLCNQQHKCFPPGQRWTMQGPQHRNQKVPFCTGNSLPRYLSSSCCAVQVPGLLQEQWEPSLSYLSHPQLPSAGALPFFSFSLSIWNAHLVHLNLLLISGNASWVLSGGELDS